MAPIGFRITYQENEIRILYPSSYHIMSSRKVILNKKGTFPHFLSDSISDEHRKGLFVCLSFLFVYLSSSTFGQVGRGAYRCVPYILLCTSKAEYWLYLKHRETNKSLVVRKKSAVP